MALSYTCGSLCLQPYPFLLCFGGLSLGTYIFRTAASSGPSILLMFFFFLEISLTLKSTLANTKIANLLSKNYVYMIFFHPFPFNLPVMVFGVSAHTRQHIGGGFFIYSAYLFFNEWFKCKPVTYI